MSNTMSVALAQAKLAAAKKRVQAAHRLGTIAAYERQANNPAYPGQETICRGKAEVNRALYDQELAEACLIEAKAQQEESAR